MPQEPALVDRRYTARLALSVVAVCALALVLFALRIGSYPLVDGDAALYGRVARTAVEKGHWLVPISDTLPNAPLHDKPPLTLWMMAASIAALGRSEVGARLWQILAAVAIVGAVTRFAGRRLGVAAGVRAGLALATSAVFFYLVREPMMDVSLALAILWTVTLGWRFEETQRPALWWGACAAIGLGVMVKGPVAAVLPAFALLVAQAMSRRPIARLWPHSWSAIVIGVAIVAIITVPWHLYLWTANGGAYAAMYFGANGWRRFLIRDHVPGAAVPLYAGLLAASVAPWSGIVCAAILSTIRAPAGDRVAKLGLAWTLAPIVFFGMSPGPVFVRYLVPALPGAAVLVSWWSATAGAGFGRTAATVQLAAGLCLAGAAGLVPLGVTPALAATGRVFLCLLGWTMTVSGVLLLKRGAPSAFVWLGCSTVAILSWFVIAAAPLVDEMLPARRVATVINRSAEPPSCVASGGIEAADALMLSYYLDASLQAAATPAEGQAFLAQRCDQWVIESPGRAGSPWNRARWQRVDVGSSRYAVWRRPR